MKFLQKLGKAVLMPVACLPLCGILMGIGYLLCPASMQGGEMSGAVQLTGLFLVKAGGAIIDHIALLFAVGIGVGMAEERDGTAAISSLASWLMITVLLNPSVVTTIMPSVAEDSSALLSFQKIENPFIGILAGLIGAACYNRFKDTTLPEWLAFFSGKRCTVIISGLASVAVSAVLLFVWPVFFGLLVKAGLAISGMGEFGAAVYATLNRLLLPFGLHHALNNVFWFDTIGLGDLTHYWAGDTSADVSWSLGIYMSGFFPCMMFGVPGATLAMIRSAKKEKKKYAMGILLSGALCSVVCGITEPFEFAFMFTAPTLYVLYSLLYGVFTYFSAVLGFRAGFAFSAGATDLLFSSSMPAAQNTWLILPLGAAAFAVFYLLFRVMITRFDLKTVGREDGEEKAVHIPGSLADVVAGVDIAALLEGLGGKANLTALDHCITRLRLDIADMSLVSDEQLKAAGAKGVMKVGKNGLQVIIGLNVQSVFEALSARVKGEAAADFFPAEKPVSAADAPVKLPENAVIRCALGTVLQPVKGRVIAQTEIPDPTFAEGILGAGVGIIPEDDTVVSPFDGTVTMIPETRHAAGLESNGMEVLIHIGIDTVKMRGEGFTALVSIGDSVKTGQPLIRFDRAAIKSAGLSDITAVMLANSDSIDDVECGQFPYER